MRRFKTWNFYNHFKYRLFDSKNVAQFFEKSFLEIDYIYIYNCAILKNYFFISVLKPNSKLGIRK